MPELKVYNLADDERNHTASGSIVCSIGPHNLKIKYNYDILHDSVIFDYCHEYERDNCAPFASELKEHVRCHWLSKLNHKKEK